MIASDLPRDTHLSTCLLLAGRLEPRMEPRIQMQAGCAGNRAFVSILALASQALPLRYCSFNFLPTLIQLYRAQGTESTPCVTGRLFTTHSLDRPIPTMH